MSTTTHLVRTIAVALAWLLLAVPANAQTSSPFQPPAEGLGRYVINSGGGLDTGCTYRSGGPLIIRFAIPSVVHPDYIRPDGTLVNASTLIANGVIGSQAILRMPVFDIDSSAATSGFSREVDRLSLNGVFKKTLTGLNNTWTDDSLVVPINELKFQSAASPGVMNELRIDIDTANVGVGEFWCMAVDWIATEFDVAAPYILTHGINSDASTWDDDHSPNVLTRLAERGVLFGRFSVTSNGSVSGNAAQLKTLITNFLAPLKSKVVHIIAHSKGGLDAQYLASLSPDFKILSLSTLSTPHYGSVAADLSIVQKTDADERINSGEDPNGYASTYVGTWTFGQGPQRPGLDDLTTTSAAEAISLRVRGNIRPTFTIGADADLNASDELENSEAEGLFPQPWLTGYGARRAWRVLGEFSAAPIVSLRTVPGLLWSRTVLTYRTSPTLTFRANDIVVSEVSANPFYGTSLGNQLNNHGTVKNGTSINDILDRTVPLR